MEENYSVDTLGSGSTEYRYGAAGRFTGQISLVTQPNLCKECNENQAHKIQELNSFKPFKESDFYSELDVFKQRLDVKYSLCQSCHEIVIQHLKKQSMDIKTFLLGNQLYQSKSSPRKLLVKSLSHESSLLPLAQLACVILASFLVCSESITDNHGDHACDGVFSHWQIHLDNGRLFLASLGPTNSTSTTEQHVHHFTSLLKVLLVSICERGRELLFCVSGLTKGKFLNISLVCLVLNLVIFVRRRTRLSAIILLCWLSFSILCLWDEFWWKANSGWKFIGLVCCWCVDTSWFMFSLLSYMRTRKPRPKRRSFHQLKQTQGTLEVCDTVDPSTMKADNERLSSQEQSFSSLDSNLNSLSLGIPTRNDNGYNIHLGEFWGHRANRVNSKESPLVSMHQRPLIVPATLRYSGPRQRRPNKKASQSSGENSLGLSSYEDTDSDSTNEACSKKNPSFENNALTRTQKQSAKPRKCSPLPRRKQLTTLATSRTSLLILSLILNFYLIILFTEWPAQSLRSLARIIARG